GPGTGKTWTLERKTEYLVSVGGVPSDAISAVTLTRSMALSLGERLPHGRAQTLHSFALEHLNRIGDAWGKKVATPWETAELIASDLAVGTASQFNTHVTPSDVRDFITKLTSGFRAGQDEPPEMTRSQVQINAVFRVQRELFAYRLMDELANDLADLIARGERIEAPSHILVDEYQDLTAGELRLLQLLASEFNTIVVACGDDRQSIYGFREADDLALHRFPNIYGVDPGYLYRSRRCPRLICEFADLIADALPELPGLERPHLEPWPGREDEGDVAIVSAPSPIAEARWVIDQCSQFVSDGVSPHEIMIVVSAYLDQVLGSLSQALDELEGGAEFHLYRGGGPAPALSAELRLLEASVRLILDAEDQMAWRTLVWATPGLGRARIDRLLHHGGQRFVENLRDLAQTDEIVGRPWVAGSNVTNLEHDADIDPIRLVEELAAILGVEGWNGSFLAALQPEEDVGPAAYWRELVVQASQADEIEPEQDPTGIPVRTIFGSKGREAPYVFLVNTIPQAFSRGGDASDAIRRLYVGITRSSGYLGISAPGNLRYTQLGHAARARFGGLEDLVVRAGERLGLTPTSPNR
ncbi:MAG TPA: ATP-dependent helicase, partial [Acidimicrobiia bacterium]|nr:ATP-dependent helicase [Acidimicrobiia bacterium]